MKNILIFLFFLPTVTFTQTEKEQKLSIRNHVITIPSTSTEKTEKTIVKRSSYSEDRQTFNNENIFQPVTYYDYDRWNWVNWGAPTFGFRGFIPSYYYDRFGLRQPSRIYTMDNGEKMTVKGVKKHWRFGLSYNTINQLGGFISYGNKTYLIAEYSSYIPNDESSFIPNLTMDKVLEWEDKKLDDIFYGGSVYIGCGIKVNSFGIYVMPGYTWTTQNFQFFDEFYILSNNGRYSFPNFSENSVTAKVGILYDYKLLTTKIDYNPFRNYINFGVGFIF